MTEYDCQRCGIHVWCAIPPPPETIYCTTCRFIEEIKDPEVKRQVAEAMDRHNPALSEEDAK